MHVVAIATRPLGETSIAPEQNIMIVLISPGHLSMASFIGEI